MIRGSASPTLCSFEPSISSSEEQPVTMGASNNQETKGLLEDLKEPGKKMNVTMTTVLLTGEMIGAAILALPFTIVYSGIYGVFLVLLVGLLCAFGGMTVGRCWQIVVERWPQYDSYVHDPFATIGYICYGRFGREFTRCNVLFMLFGCAVVLLLLGCELVQSIFSSTLSYCTLILIFGICSIPPVWLGTPKDFWHAGVFAVITSLVPTVIVIWCLLEGSVDQSIEKPKKPEITSWSVFLAYGNILYLNGGTATFPTIQNDMKDKTKFTLAVGISFIFVITIYMVIAVISYALLGAGVNSNILLSINPGVATTVAQISLSIHLLTAFFILLNPVLQDFEGHFNIPSSFGWKRVAARTLVTLLVIFVALTVPKFSYLLNVIGASSSSFLSLILPSIFFLKLVSMRCTDGTTWPQWKVAVYEKLILAFMIVIGVVGGIISTYVAVYDMTSVTTFVMPCYLRDL